MLRRYGTSIGLAALVLGLGIGAFAVLWATAPAPDRDEALAPPRTVRAFDAQPGVHRIALKSYGTAQAGDEWTARSEVEGRIETLHEDFEEGHVVPQGTVIATIDDTDFQLALQQAQAEIESQTQQLAELNQREKNDEEILELRKSQVAFAKAERDRSERQLKSGVITPSAHEKAESTYVERLLTLRTLENDLELIPIQRKLREAALRAATIQRDRAQRDIERCTIALPFPGLCIGREVESHEKVDRGQELGTFMGLERAEVVAMVEPRKALSLFPNAEEFYGRIDLTSESYNSEIRRRLQKFLVPADVTWRVGDGQAQWRGRATRVSAVVDERTRTAPAIIEIEDAFTDIRPGVRPALVPGMFVEVTLYGETLPNVFVVPRDALREGHVYLERDGELVIQPVHVVALEEEIAVIDEGLVAGDHVIVTDLFPAANGLRINAEIVDNPVVHRSELPQLHSELTPD